MRKTLLVLTTVLLLIPVAQIAENLPPVAYAGDDQMVLLGESVQLSGAGADPNGDMIVSWAWSIDSAPAGSSASFDDPDIHNPVFSPDLLGEYVLSLIVSDGTDTSDPDTLTVTVTSPNGPCSGP